MLNFKKIVALLLLCCLCAGCSNGADETTADTSAVPSTTATESEETEPVTETESETEAETETETETETDPVLPNEAELLENPVTETTVVTNEPESETSKTAVETEGTETEPAETSPVDTRIYDYLSGKTCTEEERNRRPIAIMMNNIKKCLPQNNLTAGDMYYECSAEGGITRIMMLTSNYADIGELGSVRSSRDYFVDFLANHNAIYIHAGGSEMAYDKILWRGINNLDGVNMYIPNMFYRDQYRWNTMGMEHSLMTTGENIAAGIAYKGYETEQPEDYVSPFRFYDEETNNKLVGSPASHVHMKSTSIQTVDFVYDEDTGEYLRYQYNGMPHVDGITGEQLSLKNVIILFTEIDPIPGDTAGRLSVVTVGSGQGYYITNGQRKVIHWSRDGKTDPIHMEYRNGDELILNAGKTFICVVDNSVAAGIDFEYEW